jgi:hypothetical protein
MGLFSAGLAYARSLVVDSEGSYVYAALAVAKSGANSKLRYWIVDNSGKLFEDDNEVRDFAIRVNDLSS